MSDGPGPITALIPVPRSLPFGGGRVTVSELRLRDLAELQGVLDDRWPDPLFAIESAPPAADPEDDRRAAARAHRLAVVGPPVYGDAEASAYFSSPEGQVQFLAVALRRHHPDLATDALVATWSRATFAEFGRLWRVAHGVPTVEALSRLVLPAPPRGGGAGKPASWAEMIDELSRLKPGWTYEDIYNLTITEWVAARTGGTPRVRGRRVPQAQAVAEMRRYREALRD